tara:strand:+ start:398 stop:988 length:591 start_codon:yes stop_codon:yes gene_type:complete
MNKLISIVVVSFLLSASKLPDFEKFNWAEIFNSKIIVEYYYHNDIPWCRSYIEISSSIEEISNILENKSNYPNVFDRITETILYDEDIVHIKLDMPFPWAGRDYIVKYSEYEADSLKEYSWINYDDLNIPIEKGYVRLDRARGKWRLVKLKNGNIQVEYIWNGELLGDFPKWALKTAWKEQGKEVLTWLTEYMESK